MSDPQENPPTSDANDTTAASATASTDAAPDDAPDETIDEAPAADTGTDAEVPSTTELEEPSTEKPPGEEPKAPSREKPEPSHQAVGIGVIDDGE